MLKVEARKKLLCTFCTMHQGYSIFCGNDDLIARATKNYGDRVLKNLATCVQLRVHSTCTHDVHHDVYTITTVHVLVVRTDKQQKQADAA